MRLLGLLISILICVETKAQQPASPAATPPPAAPGLTPTEMNALMNTLAETEAKNKQQQQNPQPAPQPPPEPAQASPPPQAPMPAPTPLPQGASMNPPPGGAPAFQPPPPNSGGAGSGNANNNNNVLGNRNKSPFMIPTDLYNRVKQMQTVKTSPTEGTVDSQVEVRRRWPLRDYTLVAVMWGVSSPKAMIADRENKLHVFRVKDYIANSEGYISEITNGEVIVIERGAEIKLKLKSR